MVLSGLPSWLARLLVVIIIPRGIFFVRSLPANAAAETRWGPRGPYRVDAWRGVGGCKVGEGTLFF